ncbi:MAG: conjugal transfer protein TraD [Nitrosomonas sp.]|nr:conjugal transfer protein TraD [Nitrosomonas sp.]
MRRQLIAQKLVDAQTPGFQGRVRSFRGSVAACAFTEDALNETDALDSNIDQPEFVDGGQHHGQIQ